MYVFIVNYLTNRLQFDSHEKKNPNMIFGYTTSKPELYKMLALHPTFKCS